MMFDLDGFKSYNDTFGHLAGDAVLARLGAKLADAISDYGTAYRLGGDEFCILVAVGSDELDAVVAAATDALHERGENFAVGASYGAVLLPHEAMNLDHALQIADQRMYTRKQAAVRRWRSTRRATCCCASSTPSSPGSRTTRARSPSCACAWVGAWA